MIDHTKYQVQVGHTFHSFNTYENAREFALKEDARQDMLYDQDNGHQPLNVSGVISPRKAG